MMGELRKVFVGAAVAIVVAALVAGYYVAGYHYLGITPGEVQHVTGLPVLPTIPEIVKRDCEKLVDGQLLFEPSETMRQGNAYPVFARLTRNPGVNITEGLDGTQFVIEKERASCLVSMKLDSAPEEPNAFRIDKVPADRTDDQFLEPDKYSEWDWRVTPRKHGRLHLLLYVAPILYVEGVGRAWKEFKQPPRIITVTPDYLYESGIFLKENWVIISGLLTVIVIPLLLWFRREITEWFRKRATGKKRLIVSANE